MIWPKLKGLFFYDLSFEIQKEASQRGLQVIFSMAGAGEAMRTFNRYFVDYVVFWRSDWNPTLRPNGSRLRNSVEGVVLR